MKFRILKALLIGLTSAFIAGCGGSDGGSAIDGAVKSTSQRPGEGSANNAANQENSQASSSKVLKGYIQQYSIWPTKAIPVCFAVAADTFEATEWQRQIIRTAVQNSWEANSQVRFTGWDICPTSVDQWVPGIRIKFDDSRPESPVGTGVYPLGMKLNPVYNFYANGECGGGEIKKCLEYDAIHEFGHALGFSHEQNRPDTPESCTAEKDANSDGFTPVGGWDLYSIMNYCNPNLHKVGGAVLSPTDIETVQRFYGKPGGMLYVVTKQDGPEQEITAYDTSKKVAAAVIKLPAESSSLVQDITTSPDGKRVYVLSSCRNGTYLTAINTATNKIAYVKRSCYFPIKYLEVSPDSKKLYALKGGDEVTGSTEDAFELLDAETGSSEATFDIPIPAGAALGNELYLIAKPQSDNDKVYVFSANFFSRQPRSFSILQLSVSGKKLIRRFSIDAPGESPFSATGMAMVLSIDEKTAYFPVGTDDNADFGRFAAIDLETGKMTNSPSFSVPTRVNSMQMLDKNRILFGNKSSKHGPTIFNIDTGLSAEVMSAAELSNSIGYQYVFSLDGNDIYSSKATVIEKSMNQGDGTYKTETASVRANWVGAGAMRRTFAFANPN